MGQDLFQGIGGVRVSLKVESLNHHDQRYRRYKYRAECQKIAGVNLFPEEEDQQEHERDTPYASEEPSNCERND